MNNNLNKNKQLKYSTRYMPGIDGLRNCDRYYNLSLKQTMVNWWLLGVDTFFVISGYLISLLLFEYESTGIINLKQFWLRRIRLIPAMLVLVIVVTVATLIFKPGEIVNIKQDVFAAVFMFRIGGI